MPTTDDQLAQLERWLPAHYRSVRALTGGRAAQSALAADTAEDLAGSVSIGGAEGTFLTLLARGYGVYRASNETDDSLRTRLRNIEQKVTPPAILARAIEMLTPYTDEAGLALIEVREHFDSGIWLDQDYLDQGYIYSSHNAFTLVVPLIGADPRVEAYVDQDFLDQSYLGEGQANTDADVYVALMAEIDRIRPAGVRWWLQVAEEEDFRLSIYETAQFGHVPVGDQEWPVWVPDGYRLVRSSHRPSANIVGGTYQIYRDDDGVQTAQLASSVTLTGAVADIDVDDTASLTATAENRDSPDGGAYWMVVVTNLDLGAATEGLVIPLTFDPVN